MWIATQLQCSSSLTASDGSVVDNLDGTYTITPSANFNGAVTLNYDVIDGNGGSIAASQSYTLDAVNDAPTGSASAILANGTEDTAYTVSASDLLAGFSDVDIATNGQVLSVSSLTASDGSVVDNLDGTYTITPSANFNGAVTLNYNVIDGNGGSIAASQSYTLDAVNDAPTGSASAILANGTEDTAYTVSASDLLAGFSDVDIATNGQVLSVSSLTASDGSVVDNLDGTYTITPSANFNGTVTLNYNVIDGNGGSIAASQSYTLDAVNDAPTGSASAILANGTEDTAYTVSASDLLAGFSDVDIATNGQVLSVSSLTASDGSVVDNLDGTYTITPSANFNGAVTLNYNVIDGNGGSIAASQSYTLAAVNDAPTGSASAILANGTEDTAYTVSASDLLAGFSDVDIATNGQVLSVSSLTASDGSVVDNLDGTYTITPSANFNGAVTLNYNVIDGNGGSIAASQSYTLDAVNDAAVISSGSGSVTKNATLTTNGTLTITDVDTGEASFIAQPGTTGTYGNFTLDAGGNWTYALDSTNPAVQLLPAGSMLHEIFSVASVDGTPSSVTITINGSGVLTVPSPPTPPVTESPPAEVVTVGTEPAAGDIKEPAPPVTEPPPEYVAAPAIAPVVENAPAANPVPAGEAAVRQDSREITRNDRQTVNIASLFSLDPSILANFQTGLQTNLPLLNAVTTATNNQAFIKELNQLREHVTTDAAVTHNIVGASVAVGTGLSIGYVLWLLRGGVLLGSLLSTLPAWRFIDPLPVLGRLDEGDDDAGEGESLESLVGTDPNDADAAPEDIRSPNDAAAAPEDNRHA